MTNKEGGDYLKLRPVLGVSLILVLSAFLFSTGFEPEGKSSDGQEEYISKAEALEIAKEIKNNENAEWKTEFHENAEVEPEKTTEAWVVEALYPAGNKTIYYIDAVTGEPSRVGELEAP